jgi:precorrin-3B C17-methyltransferase
MTLRARQALEESEVIIGYTVYVDLVKDHYPGKQFLTTPMRQETERVRLALSRSAEGRTSALICSGDAGVYGMSGLVEEMSPDYPGVEIEIIPGVSAMLSGAAVLGAPLTHDFAVISLSDLLTPWATIEKRLVCAAQADFVICLYNPASHRRKDHLRQACDIILQYASPETVCGLVRNIGREGESCLILALRELREAETDMFTSVFIESSRTRIIGRCMVTPRGYRK